MSTMTVLAPARRRLLERRVRLVVAITITWNVIEAIVAIGAGTVASSSALVGFGLDSVVEVLSAAAVAWQFSARDPERRERLTLRVIAIAFLALATYVGIDAAVALLAQERPDPSPIGIGIAALSLAIMPFLSWFERRTGRELGSATAVVDSKQTLLCTYLSAALLVGLVANALLGWWWADAVAGLAIAAIAVREGVLAWRGEGCCAVPGGHGQAHDRGDADHVAAEPAGEPSTPTCACCVG